MVSHSPNLSCVDSILACRYSPWGSQRVGHYWSTFTFTQLLKGLFFIHWIILVPVWKTSDYTCLFLNSQFYSINSKYLFSLGLPPWVSNRAEVKRAHLPEWSLSTFWGADAGCCAQACSRAGGLPGRRGFEEHGMNGCSCPSWSSSSCQPGAHIPGQPLPSSLRREEWRGRAEKECGRLTWSWGGRRHPPCPPCQPGQPVGPWAACLSTSNSPAALKNQPPQQSSTYTKAKGNQGSK